MDKKTSDLIDKKVKEHEFEMKGCSSDLLKVHGTKPKDAEDAVKRLALKDKLMFHKAAVATLLDLKQDLEKT